MSNKSGRKVGFVSLGCPKATFDSERILTQLRAEGYQFSSSYQEADLVVVNTCGFIDDAVNESLDTIGDALADNGRVIVTGCLGAKEEMIKAIHPQVLAVTGPDSLEDVMHAIHHHLPPEHDPYLDLVPPGGVKLTPRHYAYLKIAEGCNQQCSFCIIPSMRGKLVSRPAGDILTEAQNLVSAGVKELIVVAQDTAAYGVDKKYQTEFWNGRPVRAKIDDLVKAMGSNDAWLRLHYLYPYPHIDRLVELMAEGYLLPYIDVPLQHSDPQILKAMRRPADQENMLKRIEKWREICPDVTLRSTFIVGFPGETETQFNQLLDFIAEVEFDRAGAFAYSDVAGATANHLPDHIHPDEKEDRLERFMDLQGAISANLLQRKVDTEIEVIIDSVSEEGAVARSKGDSPEIDGVVYVEGGHRLSEGDIVKVRINSADQHDLYAELLVTKG